MCQLKRYRLKLLFVPCAALFLSLNDVHPAFSDCPHTDPQTAKLCITPGPQIIGETGGDGIVQYHWRFNNSCSYSIDIVVTGSKGGEMQPSLSPGPNELNCGSSEGCHGWSGWRESCASRATDAKTPASSPQQLSEVSGGPLSITGQAPERDLEGFEFVVAHRTDSAEAWRSFIKDYPDGVFAAYAKRRMNQLLTDNVDTSFRRRESLHTSVALIRRKTQFNSRKPPTQPQSSLH